MVKTLLILAVLASQVLSSSLTTGDLKTMLKHNGRTFSELKQSYGKPDSSTKPVISSGINIWTGESFLISYSSVTYYSEDGKYMAYVLLRNQIVTSVTLMETFGY